MTNEEVYLIKSPENGGDSLLITNGVIREGEFYISIPPNPDLGIHERGAWVTEEELRSVLDRKPLEVYPPQETAEPVLYDFGDPCGPVPAHKHPYGGGWVADSATVHPDAYVDITAVVKDNAVVENGADINQHSIIAGEALVEEYSEVGRSKIYGAARVGYHSRVLDSTMTGHSRTNSHADVVSRVLTGKEAV